MAPPFWLIGDSRGGASSDAAPRLRASDLRLSQDEPLLFAALFCVRLDEQCIFGESLRSAESLGAQLATSRDGGGRAARRRARLRPSQARPRSLSLRNVAQKVAT